MDNFLQQNILYISLSVFVGVLTVMGLWEVIKPKRKLRVKKSKRWINNFSLIFLNTFILRFLMPTSVIALSLFCIEQGWGVLNFTDWAICT